LAFVHEIKQSLFQVEGDASNRGAAGHGTAFLHLLAKQNLDVIIKALKKMEVYWAGAGVALNILEQRASGLGHARIDFEKSADHIPTFLSLPDQGILRRFTGNLGLNGTSTCSWVGTVLRPAHFPRHAAAGLSAQEQLEAIAALSPGSQSAEREAHEASEGGGLRVPSGG
jgi:hypothetical protein